MWRITKDKVDEGLSVGRTSHDFNQEAWEKAVKTKFRLLDDDGHIYFYGEYDGVNESEQKAFAPLDQWGEAFGCTELQYKENGEWKTL
jgi:hypothetical protein